MSSVKTVTLLLEATDSWAFNIDRGNVNEVIFLTWRERLIPLITFVLLAKLGLYRIRETA